MSGAGREVEVAVLLADLAGYTALTEAHGNAEAAATVLRFGALAAAALAPGATLVEQVGDQILVVAETAAAAVATARRLGDAVEREPRFPAMRGGLHVGAVLAQGGRYFGAALNVAARVAGQARGGQVLCTDRVAALAGAADGVSYRRLGPARVKNVLDPLELVEVVFGAHPVEAPVVDPVCRMQVDPATAPARLPYGGRTHAFCSFACARLFAARPEDYAG